MIVNDESTRINMYKTGVFDMAAVTPARWPDVNNIPVGSFTLRFVHRSDPPGLIIQFGVEPDEKAVKHPWSSAGSGLRTPSDVIFNQVFNRLFTRLYSTVPKGLTGYTEFGI